MITEIIAGGDIWIFCSINVSLWTRYQDL